jgi:HlyD family secretion protein
VRRIAPYVTEVEKQARTVDVEVDFDTPPKQMALLVGYSADVEAIIEQPRQGAARAHPGDPAGRQRCWCWAPDDKLETRQPENRAGQLGVSRR